MNNYNLKPYEDNDYDFVYYVKKIVYKDYVIENYGSWDEDQQKGMFKTYIENAFNNIQIVLVEDKKAGFFDGCNILNGDYQINNICLLPEFQGKGIGGKFLEKVIAEHKDQNIHLKVFKQNRAKKLYEKLGFVVCDETETQYIMIKEKY